MGLNGLPLKAKDDFHFISYSLLASAQDGE